MCFNGILMCVQMYGCVFTHLTMQQTTLWVLWWLLRGLCDHGICIVPKHGGNLLTSDEHLVQINFHVYAQNIQH